MIIPELDTEVEDMRRMANIICGKVRFNVLRVLPRTGKAVKQFNKF